MVKDKTNFATFNKEESAAITAQVIKLPTMSMDICDKTLGQLMKTIHFLCSPK